MVFFNAIKNFLELSSNEKIFVDVLYLHDSTGSEIKVYNHIFFLYITIILITKNLCNDRTSIQPCVKSIRMGNRIY
jgi:hypothetical protein